MIGRGIAFGFATARDAIARGLIRLGVGPNVLTLLGMALTILAGACYALGAGDRFAWSLAIGDGASAWLLAAAGLIILSSACDMLDGAVARLGFLKTDFGAFLDSTLDRASDFVVYAGIAIYYVSLSPANITAMALCMLAFFNAFMISYTRARAEDLIEKCRVGFWQRGERSAAILIATFAYNIPALLLQQAFLTGLTVLRRINYTRQVLSDKPTVEDPRTGSWWMKIRLWRWPRMTWGYDLAVGANIMWLIFVPIPVIDPLRDLLAWLGG